MSETALLLGPRGEPVAPPASASTRSWQRSQSMPQLPPRRSPRPSTPPRPTTPEPPGGRPAPPVSAPRLRWSRSSRSRWLASGGSCVRLRSLGAVACGRCGSSRRRRSARRRRDRRHGSGPEVSTSQAASGLDRSTRRPTSSARSPTSPPAARRRSSGRTSSQLGRRPRRPEALPGDKTYELWYILKGAGGTIESAGTVGRRRTRVTQVLQGEMAATRSASRSSPRAARSSRPRPGRGDPAAPQR